MRLKTKRLRFLFVLSFLFLMAGIVIGIGNIAYCSLSPLAPSVEVSPNHTYLGGEITLVVKVLVNGKSNVSVSRPVVMGVGDANLTSSELVYVVAGAGEVATLKWTYSAIQVGTIYFSVRISVKNLADDSVTLSEELNSREVGISSNPRTSFLGFAIVSLYILLSSYFSDFKPQVSFIELMGGSFGISIIILCLVMGMLVGYFVTSLVQTTEIQQMLVLGFFGSILSGLGLVSCWKYNEELRKMGTQTTSKDKESSKKTPIKIRMTELEGLMIVVSGLSGFSFISTAYVGLVLTIVAGIIAVGKECMERKR